MVNIFERKPEKIEEPAGEKIEEEMIEKLYEEKKEEEELEKREFLIERKKIIREKLEKKATKTKLSLGLKEEAKEKAGQIKSLDKKGKLKHLLVLAEEKGVAFAVEVAKDMKDPYILDVFHDILAKEGFYKKFQK